MTNDTEKLRKAAFLLGIATGTLLSLKERYSDSELDATLATLYKGIDELFYSEPNKKEQFSNGGYR